MHCNKWNAETRTNMKVERVNWNKNKVEHFFPRHIFESFQVEPKSKLFQKQNTPPDTLYLHFVAKLFHDFLFILYKPEHVIFTLFEHF